MRQYSSLKFISLLLLLSLVYGCNTFNKKIYKKSNIVGATVDDHNASVEIREELDEKGDIIKKNYNHPYYFTAGGLTNILSSIYYTQKSIMLGTKGRKQLYKKEELQNIIPPIISAFSMANDYQDILVFFLRSLAICSFSLFLTAPLKSVRSI